MVFDADELEAIGLGIGMVRQWTDEGFAAKADSAFEKIRAVLPATLQGELEQISTYSTPARPMPPWTVGFSELRECIRARHKLRIEYRDESERCTSRTLRPLALIFSSPVWLLAGWCERREDFRHFRLDRIDTLQIGDETFGDEPDKSLAAYLSREAACRPDRVD